MYSADMDSLVMFNFPLERLPTYTQVVSGMVMATLDTASFHMNNTASGKTCSILAVHWCTSLEVKQGSLHLWQCHLKVRLRWKKVPKPQLCIAACVTWTVQGMLMDR